MPTHIALLRAVNLPSHNKVSMADLRAWLSALGMQGPRTLLQSGNLVFGDTRGAAAVERVLEREAKARLGRHAYFVYPDGIGKSKLTMSLIERKLGTRGTARNWNTVLKLQAAFEFHYCLLLLRPTSHILLPTSHGTPRSMWHVRSLTLARM